MNQQTMSAVTPAHVQTRRALLPRTAWGKTLLIPLMLLGSAVLGVLLLWLVYLLPISPRSQTFQETAAIFQSEGLYPSSMLNNTGATLDNFTDAIMCNTAVTEVTSPLRDALLNQRSNFGSADNIQRLQELAAGNTPDALLNYARYWNGYLVPLKTEMALGLNITQIRLLNVTVFACVVLFTGWAALKRAMPELLVVLSTLLLVCNTVTLFFSMQYLPCLLIAVLATGVLLLLPNLQTYECLVAFLVVGIITNYFDFLTAPLLTLGVPLAVVLYRKHRLGESKQLFWTLGTACLGWGLGYFGFWVLKWLIGSLGTGVNVFADASSQAKMRTSDKGSYWDVIRANLRIYAPYLAVWLVPTLLVAAAYAIDRIRRRNALQLAGTLPLWTVLTFVALLPFLWAAFMTNHLLIHTWMTYRIFALVICAFQLGVLGLLKPVSPPAQTRVSATPAPRQNDRTPRSRAAHARRN